MAALMRYHYRQDPWNWVRFTPEGVDWTEFAEWWCDYRYGFEAEKHTRSM